jgi:leucyl/phenylalanyl-tRNA---protein transferase
MRVEDGWMMERSSPPITPELLVAAYRHGIFPMGDPGGGVSWYDPDPRAILPLERLHVPRRLRRVLHTGGFHVTVNRAFREVLEACAESAPGREQTWITDELIPPYLGLRGLGLAHSVEVWLGHQLVGGLYGVSLGGFFAGESMFSRRTDGSKVALVHLVERLNERGFVLLDVQFRTAHLARFGVIEIPRAVYRRLLGGALNVRAQFD